MNARKLLYVVLVLLPLTVGSLSLDLQTMSAVPGGNGSTPVDVGNGQFIEVGPDETLHTYTLSQAPSVREGSGSPLNVSEYGQRTDSFIDLEAMYASSSGSTTNQTVSVPMGPLWQGTELFANISDLQENRTWITNPGFDGSATNWTFGTDDVGVYTNTINAGYETNYVTFDMLGQLSGGYYRFDEGDRAYAEQNISVDRGDVTWVGVVLDYWVDDAWGGLPIGFWELYVQVGHADVVANHLWNLQFSDVAAQTTWYSSGLVEADSSLISLPDPSNWHENNQNVRV